MNYLKNRFVQFAIFVIIAELFLFNFRTFESLLFHKAQNYEVTYSESSVVSDGVQEPYEKAITFPESGDCYIEIPNLNQTVSNVYLNIAYAAELNEEVSVTLSARDEGNTLYYSLPEFSLDPNDTSSLYKKLNLSGKALSLKITFNNGNNNTYYFDTPAVNVTRPFLFSPVRMILLYITLCILYFLRPASSIYGIRYSLKSSAQRLLLIAMASLELISLAGVTLTNEDYVHPAWEHHQQYAMMAEAISEGHFYLNLEPSAELKALENPYDRTFREAEGVSYMWDTAYFEGKYYVYFGIVPVLTFYLPYYLLTGKSFPTWFGIYLVEAAIVIGLFFLLHALFKKYFKSATLGLYILMQLLLLIGSGLFVIAMNATFYQLPISMAIAFTIWGLYFWTTGIQKKGFSLPRLIVGSLCMALVAGCRPQILLGSFLALPLLLPEFLARIKISKERAPAVKALVLALLPYVVVAAFLMYYNAARFGSPFDFGANYNLTTNDMTHRGFHLDRIPLGSYMYLLQPLSFSTAFPFIRYVPANIQYMGRTILEGMFGGIIWLVPLLFTLPLYFKVKDVLKSKKLKTLIWLLLFSAIIIVIADVQMAGILFRYFCDFGFFLSLAAVLIILAVDEKIKDQARSRLWHYLLYAGSVSGGLIWFLIVRYVNG